MADSTATPAPQTPAIPTPAEVAAHISPASGARPPAAPAAPAAPEPADGDEPLREPGKKALDAERAARAKAEADLAALRKQIEDANKTAEQKAADDLKAAQAEAAANAARALRYEIAAEAGIPLTFAPRLTGSTREEIATDADALKALLIPAGATPVITPGPQPDPGQGPRPQTPKSEDDQIYEALYGPQTRK